MEVGMIKFVYFDIGGVVILDLTANNGWAKMKKDLGITPEKDAEFEEFFDKIEYEVNKGLDVESLIPIMKNKFGLCFSKDYSLLADFVNRFKKNESIWPVIREIQKTCRVGLLTNMYPNMLKAIEGRRLLPKIKWEIIIDSSIEGIAKPDAEIFKLAELKASIKGEDILFVENSKSQVEAARKLSWRTFLYDPANPEKSSNELLKLFK